MRPFSLTIGANELSKGLRHSKRMPRNSKFLVECSGAVGRDGALQALDEITRLDTTIQTLNFDAQTGSFTIGNTVTGAISGATGVVTYVSQSGGVGCLVLNSVSGTFQDDEIIYEASYGSEKLADTTFDTACGVNWICDTPWIISGGNATIDGSQDFPFPTPDLIQAGIFSAGDEGNFYIVTLDMTAWSAGYFRTKLSGIELSCSDDWVLGAAQLWTFICRIESYVNDAFYFEAHSTLACTIGNVSLKQITNAALANGTASSTFTFPYPQIFVFTNVIIVCSATDIYEWVSGALVHKLNVAAGSTWSAVDFFDYVYLSNGTVAVVRDAMDKTYSETTDLPTAMAVCNFNGQALLGSPDAGYEA